jgi:hypothetical protein
VGHLLSLGDALRTFAQTKQKLLVVQRLFCRFLFVFFAVLCAFLPSLLSPEEKATVLPNVDAMKEVNLIALAERMISTSFPALREMRLKLEIIDSDDFVMAMRLEGKEIQLDVSREDFARMEPRVVSGVLAHELCHAEEDYRHGPFLENLLSWLCERFPRLETRMERRIDNAVIRKGYGNELLAFQRYHDEYYEAYDETDGLTVKEIEQALRRS